MVVTIEQLLREYRPNNEGPNIIKEHLSKKGGCGYDVYYRLKDGKEKLAYECHSCKAIVWGPPRIEAKSEHKTLEFYCARIECNQLLELRNVP